MYGNVSDSQVKCGLCMYCELLDSIRVGFTDEEDTGRKGFNSGIRLSGNVLLGNQKNTIDDMKYR